MNEPAPHHPPKTPSLRFDWQDWLPYFDDPDVPLAQKREMIETLWSLVLSFVDLGFDLNLNRPGFTGEFFVQNLCGFFKGDHARMECVLPFLRRPVANGAV